MPDSPITNFKDSNNVDLGKKLVTKDYLLEVYGSILENSPASGLIVTPELWVWGFNNGGELGVNDTTQRNTPVTTFAGGNNWKSVDGNATGHTAAIKTDGTLWVWGTNGDAQLGINQGNVTRSTPVTTFAGTNTWKQVACGQFHTAAIKTDGTLWNWGNNAGSLGTNDTTKRSTPVTTFAGGTNWKQVSAGYAHTAAIKTDGSLWVWGFNDQGQLGDFSTSQRNVPVTTFAGGTTWKQVSCGERHTAAIKTDGSLWVWGRNHNAQLGINNTDQKNTPVTTFAGGNDWKQVACGFEASHTAAIKTDGSLWVWGSNSVGQLGINNISTRSTPVTTFAGGNNWKSILCGDRRTAAIKTDGSLWNWGLNNGGQLGTNGGGNRSTPVTTFAGGNNWKSVGGRGGSTIAIQTIDYI